LSLSDKGLEEGYAGPSSNSATALSEPVGAREVSSDRGGGDKSNKRNLSVSPCDEEVKKPATGRFWKKIHPGANDDSSSSETTDVWLPKTKEIKDSGKLNCIGPLVTKGKMKTQQS